MRIKEPSSNSAISSLFELLNDLRSRVEICSRVRHNTVTILYMSTYTLNVNVVFNGVSLLNLIRRIIDCNPNNVICVLRTISPTFLTGVQAYRHEGMLKKLENIGCYVRDFDPNFEEFINHAKFVIAMHYCFDERARYYGHYYGSTNLTIPGLTNVGYLRLRGPQRRRRIMDNYEVYKYFNLNSGYLYDYAGFSQRILMDIEETLEWYLARTDMDMLTKRLNEHLDWIRDLTTFLSEIVRGTTLADLVKAYFFSSIAIYMAMSFIGSLPGKKLTRDIIEKIRGLAREIELETVLELDQILLNDEALKYNEEKLLEILDASREKLMHDILNRVELLQTICNEVENYRKAIYKLETFLDDYEVKIYKRVKDYVLTHLELLKKLQSLISKG